MIQLKSIKTGRESMLSDQEYAQLVHDGKIDMKKFKVTEIRSRPIVPSMKTPVEVEKIKKK